MDYRLIFLNGSIVHHLSIQLRMYTVADLFLFFTLIFLKLVFDKKNQFCKVRPTWELLQEPNFFLSLKKLIIWFVFSIIG